MPRRCSQTTRAGSPCQQWAVRGTDPPRCPAHPEKPRRPRLTAQVAEQLLAALRAGAYVAQACEAAGISRRTFYEWWRAGAADDGEPELVALRESVEAAKAQGEVRQVAYIATAAQSNWQAAAWLLERRYPERWARASQRDRDAIVAEATEATEGALTDPFAEIDELAKRRRERV
jgi:hypothetical protein